MGFFSTIGSFVRARINQFAAYVATLYYLEIIILMFALTILYGKVISIVTGIILSLVLAYHIIQLYYRKNLHRRIQLYIIDLHAAFSAGYIFFNVATGIDNDMTAILVLAARAIILASELPLIYLLTCDSAIEQFI